MWNVGLNQSRKNIYFCPVFRWLGIALLMLLIVMRQAPAYAAPGNAGAADAARRLVQFCANTQAGFDAAAAAVLVDYVLVPKASRETALPEMDGAEGAYYEFDTRITFSRFLNYAYNAKVPAVVTGPSSVRSSIWTVINGKSQHPLDKWKPAPPADKPVIIHGVQCDCITPDLNTGVYYEYDLRRTLIHYNYKGRHVLISVSKQAGQSDVGRKGLILGNDDDWSYYYSGAPGSYKSGIGWVKSYIYDYFSVVVYAETGTSPNMVRTATFQWLRAGWNGINFVKSGHIQNGLKRFSRNFKSILESPHLPAPAQLAKHYQQLSALPARDLVDRYAALQRAQYALAARTGKPGNSDSKGQGPFNNISREQMVQELMLEHLKTCLGKPSLLGKSN